MQKILIADDSLTFRNQLKDDLGEAGYEVLAAENGLLGIELLRANEDVKVAILDVNMPGATGIEVLENCKEIIAERGIVVLMLTTDSSPELKQKGRELGVRAWITKPYKKEALLFAINKVLNS